MISKKVIKAAKQIRERAAQRWQCAVQEIDWASCVAFAYAEMRGEKFDFVEEQKVEFSIYKKEIDQNFCFMPYIDQYGTKKWEWRLDSGKRGMFGKLRNDPPRIHFWEPVDLGIGKKVGAIKIDCYEEALEAQDRLQKEWQDGLERLVQSVISGEALIDVKIVGCDYPHYSGSVDCDRKKYQSTSIIEKAVARMGVRSMSSKQLWELPLPSISSVEKIRDMGFCDVESQEDVLKYHSFREGIATNFKAPLQKIIQPWVDAQKKSDEKKAKYNEDYANRLMHMSQEDIIKEFFVGEVLVDEDGCFSDCPPYCDDCFPQSHWTKDTPQEVRDAASTLQVSSKKEKTYTYRSFDKKSREVFLKKYGDLIEERRKQEIKRLRCV